MTTRTFSRLGSFIIIMMLTNGIGAQPESDLLKGMPKDQKEHCAKVQEILKQFHAVGRIDNPLARNEAKDKALSNTKEFMNKSKIISGGVKDWVGKATFANGGRSLVISCDNTFFRIKTEYFSGNVFDVAKKLKDGDVVRFSIDKTLVKSDTELFYEYESGLWKTHIENSSLLISLSIITPK